MDKNENPKTTDEGASDASSQSALSPLDIAIARYELDELAVKLKQVLREFRSLHSDEPEGEAINTVWNVVRLVSASALIEHLRLLGVDVTAHEQELKRGRSVVWRDLLYNGGDSETGDLATVNEPDAMCTEQLEPKSSDSANRKVGRK